MKQAVLMALLAIFTFLPRTASAFVARGDSVYFDGFVSLGYNYEHKRANSDNHLALGDLWINGMKNIGHPKDIQYSYMEVSTVVSRGKIEVKQASIKCANPFKVIKAISKVTVGRFAPPFAEEWLKYPDQLNLIGYSSIFGQLVYRDDGAQIDFIEKRLRWSLASFLGEREGGVMREQKDGKIHLYSKAILDLPAGLGLSGSYRWSRTRDNLWAAAVKWRKGSSENISFEAVGFGEDIQWFFNYGKMIAPDCIFTARYENLRGRENIFTPGIRYYTKNIDVKLMSRFADDLPKGGQLSVIFRF
ncbi:MAG: hypothetical protein Q8Q95_03750 [bacterium]|nr:hypothetical protein [bacterium]